MKIEPGDVVATGTGAGLLGLRLAFADKGDLYDYVLIGYHNLDRNGYEFWDRLEDYMILTADKTGQPFLEKIKIKIPPDLKRKIIKGILS